MIDEFEKLGQKVDEAAALIQTLRQEKEALQAQVICLKKKQDILTARMSEAYTRIQALVEQVPSNELGS